MSYSGSRFFAVPLPNLFDRVFAEARSLLDFGLRPLELLRRLWRPLEVVTDGLQGAGSSSRRAHSPTRRCCWADCPCVRLRWRAALKEIGRAARCGERACRPVSLALPNDDQRAIAVACSSRSTSSRRNSAAVFG